MASKNGSPHGVLVPIVTPFRKDGAIDIPRFNDHLAWLVKNGVDGVVVGGTTGEGHRLRRDQKFQLIDAAAAARPHLRKGIQLIAGTGTWEYEEAKAVSAYSREKGCEALLVLPPRKSDQAGIEDFYTALSRDIPGIGILAYNIPWLSNVELEPATVARLVGKKAILGVKDSSQDRNLLSEWKGADPKTLLAVGSDNLIFHGVHNVAAEAVIVGIGNLVPKMIVDIFENYGSESAALQAEVTELSLMVSSAGDYVGSLKERLFRDQPPEA